jgi:hypothetical protein
MKSMAKKVLSAGAVHTVPADLRKALISDSAAREKWEDITPLARNEWICWVISVKKASSDVDLMVVGDVSFSDVVSTLAKIETKLGREVNPTVYGPREFREKLAAKNHFLSTVAKEKKLFVIGDEREFRRLGQERVARRA